VKIVRASHCRTTPWKNGGGSTTEIAVEPFAATLDNFDWRISMARVASDGPFSEFAGIDRTLSIVKGNGLALTVGDAAPVVLDRNSEPIRFPGDRPTSARLLADEIIDLNVMTRRGRFEHRLQRLRAPAQCEFDGHDIAVVVACSSDVTLTLWDNVIRLANGDAAILERAGDASFGVASVTEADCHLVLLRECRDQAG
jgi:environmental stress-induced protein Ves